MTPYMKQFDAEFFPMIASCSLDGATLLSVLPNLSIGASRSRNR
jgi:hypothetical protein